MSDEDRRRASELMRAALALLDTVGEMRPALHLQLALDLLDENSVSTGSGGLPTCH